MLPCAVNDSSALVQCRSDCHRKEEFVAVADLEREGRYCVPLASNGVKRSSPVFAEAPWVAASAGMSQTKGAQTCGTRQREGKIQTPRYCLACAQPLASTIAAVIA